MATILPQPTEPRDAVWDLVFTRLPIQEAPAEMLKATLLRLHGVQEHRARVRFFSFGASSIICFILTVLFIQQFSNDANASNFTQFLSLIFSDTRIVIAHWQEFAWSFLEALPASSLTLAFGSLFATVLFFSHMQRNRLNHLELS